MDFVLLGLIVLGAFGLGSLFGWRLCRGLARTEGLEAELDDTCPRLGETVLRGFPSATCVRVTLDPGEWPWSGARTAFVDLTK